MAATPWRAVVAALLALVTVAGCVGSDPADGRADRLSSPASPGRTASSAAPESSGAGSSAPPAPAGLVDAYACPGGFTCGALLVPLDRTARRSESLRLQVAVETDPTADRGILVALNGGPGAAGAPLAEELVARFGADVVAAYRLVVLDQRGTGPTALRCPALQQSAGSSFPPSRQALVGCAKSLGRARVHYGTDDVVADLDGLRAALGVPEWTLFAVSYGTFVAQQYAMRYPRRTTALALDSALPPVGVDTLQLDVVRASRRVLRSACAAASCSGDPVADLARVVDRDGSGAKLLDLMAAMSSIRPSYDSLLPALRTAARADRTSLDRLLEAYRTGFATTPEIYSAALHASAFCADQRFPWGRADVPVRARAAAVRQAVARLAPADIYPLDRAGVQEGSAIEECRPWPTGKPSRLSLSPRRARLPAVPVFLLLGDRDLAAPMESILEGPVARGRRVRVEVVKGAGHIVSARPGRGRRLLRDFLLR